MNRRLRAALGRLAFSATLGLAASAPAAAAASDLEPSAPGSAPRWQLFPAGDLYDRYLADPHQPTFGVTVADVADPGLEGSGDRRMLLKLGGVFGLLRYAPRDGAPWQLAIAAGFDGMFDVARHYDNVGWDGIYGLALHTRRRGGVDLSLGLMHTSSHLGDELIERTGRRRLNYTREEAVLGVSWRPAGAWRLYGAVAHGYELRNRAVQEPGRLQAGVEHVAAPRLLGGRAGWYAALDLSALEERDWQVDPALQVGLRFPSADPREHRVWRVGLSWYDGRVPIGELSLEDERYLGIGVWLHP